ncbi:MAG: hypothetical protein GC191_09185 [Azospirillum sp.]|nr:hypothetical protein [Azospirillum sp.]
MSEVGLLDHRDRLNRSMPAASKARLGDCMYDLINALTALQAQHNLLLARIDTDNAAINALQAKYNLLLAHLDTANVAGIDAANAATYGVVGAVAHVNTAATFAAANAVALPENR